MNEQNISQTNDTNQSSKYILTIVIAIIITAIIIGGGIYLWQKSIMQSIENSLQQQIVELQGQIINLQQTTPLDEDVSEVIQSTDIVAEWKVYKNLNLGIQFQYPKDWIIREQITEYNNRIYIENQEYKNYNISNYPKDFLSVWIDYRKPTTKTMSYEENIKYFENQFNNGFVENKETINNDSVAIHTYEFGYDPNREKSGVGPYLEAVWEDNSWIYRATTMDSDYRENNRIKVDTLKQILSTLEFIK